MGTEKLNNQSDHSSNNHEPNKWTDGKTFRIAYVDEPPYYWTEENNVAKGSDIELAEVILEKIGITSIEYKHVTFEELIPGLKEGRWDMNVPIFVTEERSKEVDFTIPVWALGDGFLVKEGNPKNLTSYRALAHNESAVLALIPGQVQIESAKAAGVKESQIIFVKNQDEAIEALKSGKADAFAATAVGNRATASEHEGLGSVVHDIQKDEKVPVGGFSVSKNNPELLRALNLELEIYLGSPDHTSRMDKYGITEDEINPIIPNI